MTSSQCELSLREVTGKNVSAIGNLSVSEEQAPYVAPTAVAIAEASYSKNELLHAIYADETPVGLAVIRMQPDVSRYFLWRFMIDAQYQGLRYGSRAMGLLIEHVKTDPNCIDFLTSVVPGDHSPQKFYESLGFQLTGESFEGEAMMRLVL